jgi:hypothetical protein
MRARAGGICPADIKKNVSFTWQNRKRRIPPEENGEFAAGMEDVLDVCDRERDEKRPLVRVDECPKQLIGETRIPLSVKP